MEIGFLAKRKSSSRGIQIFVLICEFTRISVADGGVFSLGRIDFELWVNICPLGFTMDLWLKLTEWLKWMLRTPLNKWTSYPQSLLSMAGSKVPLSGENNPEESFITSSSLGSRLYYVRLFPALEKVCGASLLEGRHIFHIDLPSWPPWSLLLDN